MATTDDVVLLERSGNVLRFNNPHNALNLDEVLSYWSRTFFRGYELQKRRRIAEGQRMSGQTPINPEVDVSRCKLYHKGKDGFLYTGAGFVRRLHQTFTEIGIPVQYHSIRPRPDFTPDWESLRVNCGLSFRHRQDEVLIAIASYDGLLIEAPTGYGKSYISRMLCHAFPKRRILFVFPGLALLGSFSEIIPEAAIVGGSKCGDHARNRLVACCDKSLGKIDIAAFDLIVYDEVHSAASPFASKMLGRMTDARMVGFSATLNKRSDNADLRLESMFGPTMVSVTYEEAQSHSMVVPIEVTMVPMGIEGDSRYAMLSPKSVNFNRICYWSNVERNSKIAEVVREKQRENPEDQILILVESAEHLINLHRMLPDFEVMYGSGSAEIFTVNGYTPLTATKRKEIRNRFSTGAVRYAIATHTWKQGVDFKALRWVVRADGGASEINNIQIGGRVSRTSSGKTFGGIIDFADHFHNNAFARSRTRKNSYEAVGWKVR